MLLNCKYGSGFCSEMNCSYYISLASFSRCSWHALLLRPCLFMNINGNTIQKNIHDQICQKGSYTRTVSRHNFHRHLITISMEQQHVWLILLKVEQSAFPQTSFSSMSDVHECSGDLQMAPSYFDKQTAITTTQGQLLNLCRESKQWYLYSIYVTENSDVISCLARTYSHTMNTFHHYTNIIDVLEVCL